VQLAGKLGRRGIVSAIHPGHLFFVTDSSSHCRYLVDTGSAFSIMPWQFSSPPAGPGLSGADGRRIPCWGEQPFTVTIGGVPRQWTFLLAAVSFPILGIDFLHHHSLVVDVANQRLSSPSPRVNAIVPGQSYAEAVRSPLVVPSSPSATAGAASPPLAAGEWLAAMRLQFPKVFFQDAAASSLVPPHGVRHVIRTVGQPATAKFQQLDPTQLAAAKQEFESVPDEGIIHRSSSQWSSLLHMVQKKDSSWRPCGNYRRLNLQTVKDKYPLPNMANLAACLEDYRLFSKLDLRKGYIQVPVAAEDVAKTAIIMPFGLFKFTRMPFGLRNAGTTFQRLMTQCWVACPSPSSIWMTFS
jgi:hypothetical protein